LRERRERGREKRVRRERGRKIVGIFA